MATLKTMYDVRNDLQLRGRVTAAIAKVASYILVEPVNTPNHRNRIKWAFDALYMPEQWADRMLWAVAANGTVQDAFTGGGEAAITDSDVEYVVNVSVDNLAQ